MYLWALPVTLVGLWCGLLARSSGGVLAAGGWRAGDSGRLARRGCLRRGFPFSGPVAAITLGHVVVGVSLAAPECDPRPRACACQAV